MSYSALSIFFEYLCYGIKHILILSVRGSSTFYTSDSDAYRRQIPTYKDGPRAETKIGYILVFVFAFHICIY